jgi:lysophospholipase L1-like esterase
MVAPAAPARRRRAAFVALVAVLLLGAETTLRVHRFGFGRAAIGPWSPAAPWERLRRLGPDGFPLLVPGGDGAWALAPGQPVVRYRLNRVGLREDREAAPRPAPGACRVLAVGDAYTFGYGVEARQAYPSVLARRLRPHGAFEVLNGGFPNLNAAEIRRRLATLLPALEPRLVVVSFSWWNVQPAVEERSAPARWSRAWLVRHLEDGAVGLGAHLGVVHETFRRLRHRMTPAVFPASGMARELEPLALPPERIASRWAGTKAALAGMAADAAAVGARLAIVATPLDLQVDRRRNQLYRNERLPYPSHGFVDLDYVAADRMPAALARFASEAGIPLVDATRAFRTHSGARLFLEGDYHAAPAGHRLVAREVERWILASRPCARPEAEHRKERWE